MISERTAINMSNNCAALTAEALNCEITPIDSSATPDFGSKSRFRKLTPTTEQNVYLSNLFQQIPLLVAGNSIADTYKLVFPAGVDGTLMALKRGGKSSLLVGDDGKIVGTASLVETTSGAMFYNAFSAMSVITGQYFLAEITSELKMISLNLDKILEFLYGDKRAELLSELNFVKYACKNFGSIMSIDVQRIATISSLQRAKTIAMRDIEFYITNLSSKKNEQAKDYSDFEHLSDEALKIKDSLGLAMQLYALASIMEVYFSQNWDKDYLEYIKQDVAYFCTKSREQIISSFSGLEARNKAYKQNIITKFDSAPLAEQFSSILEQIKGEDSLATVVSSALNQPKQQVKFYLNSAGEIYQEIN
jgi:hypothetical protein